jgi:hypothetical protein
MFGDLGKIMGLVGNLKTKLPALKEKMERDTYTAESGGGAVKATVNGKLAIVDISIADRCLADSGMDREMLEDLIKAAISAAQKQAAEATAAALMELTGGIDLPGLGDLLSM